MTIKEVTGDILDYVGEVQIIAHQVNNKGVMGGGLAAQIRNKYPHVYKTYSEYCNGRREDDLLGFCQVTNFSSAPEISTLCANLFGQTLEGMGRDTNYEALYVAMEVLKDFMLKSGLRTLAIPHSMGCGLGGGDWRIVRTMIEVIFEDAPVEITIVKYGK